MIIPDHFEVKNKFFQAKKYKMKIKSSGKKIGEIVETKINLIRQFQLINAHQNLIAIARRYDINFGNVFEIFDQNNNKIGAIQHHFCHNESKCQKYIVRNASGKIISQTNQFKENSNQVNLFDNHQIKIGQMRHQTGLLKDKWDIHIFGSFDRRLVIFMPLFVELQKQSGNKNK